MIKDGSGGLKGDGNEWHFGKQGERFSVDSGQTGSKVGEHGMGMIGRGRTALDSGQKSVRRRVLLDAKGVGQSGKGRVDTGQTEDKTGT